MCALGHGALPVASLVAGRSLSAAIWRTRMCIRGTASTLARGVAGSMAVEKLFVKQGN